MATAEYCEGYRTYGCRSSPTGFTIGHNVSNREEVDKIMKEAEEAGATIVKPQADTFYGGYAGYFQDPDGHLWEVVWNPQFQAEV